MLLEQDKLFNDLFNTNDMGGLVQGTNDDKQALDDADRNKQGRNGDGDGHENYEGDEDGGQNGGEGEGEGEGDGGGNGEAGDENGQGNELDQEEEEASIVVPLPPPIEDTIMEMNFESTGEIDFFTADIEEMKGQLEEEYGEEEEGWYQEGTSDDQPNSVVVPHQSETES